MHDSITDYVNQIVQAIQRGYKKKPRVSILGRETVTVHCTLHYMKSGARRLPVDSNKFRYESIFHELFTLCEFSGGNHHKDKPILYLSPVDKTGFIYRETPDAHLIRHGVESVLGIDTVKAFCRQIYDIRLTADLAGHLKTHEKRIIRNRFKKHVISAIKAGLPKQEMIDIIDAAICDDVMCG